MEENKIAVSEKREFEYREETLIEAFLKNSDHQNSYGRSKKKIRVSSTNSLVQTKSFWLNLDG